MRVWLAATMAALAVGEEVQAQSGPVPPRSEIYTREYLVSPDGRLLNVLKGIDDKRECSNVDTSSITPRSVSASGAKLISDALVSNGHLFQYYFWVIEPSGIHTVFRAGYIQKNCALTETRSLQSYYAGDNRFREAADAYNKLLRDALGPGSTRP